MKLTVNGEERDTDARTLAALWAAETAHLRVSADADATASRRDEATEASASGGAPEPQPRRGFAIALNGEVVRASRWDETTVDEGDRVEIIRAVAGG